jgi:hypothetical protein
VAWGQEIFLAVSTLNDVSVEVVELTCRLNLQCVRQSS